ncbi:KilA-N domain-containing protein [Aeromonas veronii]|uniref:KilA-N domain-containing protein n=1 Tax=Aeromonas veronii TaxID=654 RepID=UPI0012F6A66C|nr:KilA-N domain-containing protein [Aeromonas veronii]QGW97825.1 KilA-N domain-containing protein [Aeromonas veronii]
MKITFNGNTYPIRKNAEGLYSLTDIEKAWLAEGNTGGQLDNWKRAPEVTELIELREIHVFQKRGGNRTPDRGTWGCKEAVIEYASYCSNEFRRAVRKAFIALTEGDTMQAAAIAESVAVSPELLEKHDATRKAMNDAIKAKGIDMCGKAYGNFYRLACKAATGYVPSVLTGKNGSAKEYIKQVSNVPCMNALIACMETITMGLKVGLDYHKVAAMLNVETSQNGELLG